jgi:hypothetical protein
VSSWPIRGDLLAEQLQNLTPAITFDGAQTATPSSLELRVARSQNMNALQFWNTKRRAFSPLPQFPLPQSCTPEDHINATN